jgi:hypothetical protein
VTDTIFATPTAVIYPQESCMHAHLMVDVHIENPAASDLCRVLIQRLGLEPVFKTHHLLVDRFYRNPVISDSTQQGGQMR